MTLGFFPTPLPGEDFRSVLFRYHQLSLNKEIVETNVELFGTKTEFTIFPRGLELLYRQLPSNHSISLDAVISNHTLLPYLLPFIPERHQINIYNEMRMGGGIEKSSIGKLAGNKYGRCIETEIKYCGNCIEEDIKTYGTAFIHLEHQLAFIQSCKKHNAKLSKECNECGESLGYLAINGCCRYGHTVRTTEVPLNLELQLGLIGDLSTLKSAQLSLSIVRNKLFEHLNNRGYLTADGKVKRKKLGQDLINFYSMGELESVGISADYILQRHTLERLFWGESLVVNLPLVLIFIRFLCSSFDDFIHSSNSYSVEIPFGLGPWDCKNKLCPQYTKMVIKKCVRIDKKHRGVTGKFECPTCKLRYAKEWTWKNGGSEEFRSESINENARNEMIPLYLNGMSINDIAQKHYCSVSIVKNIINDNQKPKKREHNEEKRKTYRDKLKEVINENPNLKRYAISLKCITAYSWLKKYDSEWLESRLPVSRSFDRFDWKEVDHSLAKRVVEVASNLISLNPNTRVGPYSILNGLNKTERGRIKTYSRHLPLTMEKLKSTSETKEQYQLRHLPALVWQLKTYYDYQVVTIETIMSYRRSYREISIETRKVFAKRLKEIQI